MSIKEISPNNISFSFNELLPVEVIQSIFDGLNGSQLRTCNLVCKKWCELASDEAYLKTRYEEPEMAFGQKKWETYIGNPGKVPRLPDNINVILESPCPIYDGKKIKETHVLVYIPKQVNGRPHTINNIGKLVPIGGNQTGYRFVWPPIVEEHGDTAVEKDGWVLMTKDLLPGSRCKSYDEVQTLTENLSKKAKANYQVPKLIEAITCFFAEFLKSGNRLYYRWQHDDTYTYCQEASRENPLIVGGFTKDGLYISNILGNSYYVGIGAVRELKPARKTT